MSSQLAPDERTFRPPAWQRWQYAAMTVLGAAAAAAGVGVSLNNSDGSFAHPRQEAAVVACVGTLFVAAGLYLTATFARSRLVLSADALRLVTAFTDRTFRLEEVVAARWQPVFLGGSIRLRTVRRSVTLQFTWFVDGRDLPPMLRRALPPDRQQGFERYEAMTAARRSRGRRQPAPDAARPAA